MKKTIIVGFVLLSSCCGTFFAGRSSFPDCDKSHFVACVMHPGRVMYGTTISQDGPKEMIDPNDGTTFLWEDWTFHTKTALCGDLMFDDGTKMPPYHVMAVAESYKYDQYFQTKNDAWDYMLHWCKP